MCNAEMYDISLTDMQCRWLEALHELLSNDNYIRKCMSSATEERYNHDHDPHTGRFTSGNGVDNGGESGIIEENTKVAVNDVHIIGKIDVEIYKCVTKDIMTDEVIITERQIEHIKERHPNDFERFSQHFEEIIKNPDYIIEANKPNTALILKEVEVNKERFKTILRLVTSQDNSEYKNSIITFMKIDEKDWKRILKNKKILYKSE